MHAIGGDSDGILPSSPLLTSYHEHSYANSSLLRSSDAELIALSCLAVAIARCSLFSWIRADSWDSCALMLLINIECLPRVFEQTLHAFSWYRGLVTWYGLVAAVGGTTEKTWRSWESCCARNVPRDCSWTTTPMKSPSLCETIAV